MKREELIKNIESGFWGGFEWQIKTPKLYIETIKLLFPNNKELKRMSKYEREMLVDRIVRAIAKNDNIYDEVHEELLCNGYKETETFARLKGNEYRLRELFNEIVEAYKEYQKSLYYYTYKEKKEFGNNYEAYRNGCRVSLVMFKDTTIQALEHLLKATSNDKFIDYMSTKYKSDQVAVGKFFIQLTHTKSKNIYDYCDTVELEYELNDDYTDDISTISDVYHLCSNGGALTKQDIDNATIGELYYNYYTCHIYNSENPRAVFTKDVDEFIDAFNELFLEGGVL